MKRRWKFSRSKRSARRDKDYRGQKTSIDWTRLAYRVGRGQAGALQVLQDALLTYFPTQFENAQKDALEAKGIEEDRAKYWKDQGRAWMTNSRTLDKLILFLPKIARYRFREGKDPRSHKDLSPFRMIPMASYRVGSYGRRGVVVWTTKDKMLVRKHFLRRRLLRPDYFDKEELIHYSDEGTSNATGYLSGSRRYKKHEAIRRVRKLVKKKRT